MLLFADATLSIDRRNTTASIEDIRINQLQAIGTHNSYHVERRAGERKIVDGISNVKHLQDEYYSHKDIYSQLEHQSVRSLEFDLHTDDKGALYSKPALWKLLKLLKVQPPFDSGVFNTSGIKVFHTKDLDVNAVCHTFVDCLHQLKTWSDTHRTHIPITVSLQLKTDTYLNGTAKKYRKQDIHWSLPRILAVETEILSVFPPQRILRSDDMRHPNLTLEQSILHHGWPTLGNTRGRILFYFDTPPTPSTRSVRHLYTLSAPSLQNRTVFTSALEGSPDAAFIKRDNPLGNENFAEIQRLVRLNYMLRTRADVPLRTVRKAETERRERALASGAQIVSTDFPAKGVSGRYGSNYTVRLPGEGVARCNPVNAPAWCWDGGFE
ncbi:hypothetical protein COCMIDRAFT_109236 [Bipolaris oryzae ATCC 44560]|uniref:Phosphatidylinositol-specific phospholipase C X domain-containing protein n=1 Tax=Bipolaris oryzae ATCC 44560 TaxID=930090 RepID=W6YM24_COCMI|nr:uncharacterized protein COCMIDRAFT_109236 [Bipolaris oryzae ATCC 44560]EUC40272.1 hypothetical protein COCMIDRAFT_109236 [Bipolaris oryzae ATCC 44560]